MTYNSIWQSMADLDLRGRITAAVGQETPINTDVGATYLRVQWPVLTAQDIEAAYAFALAQGNPEPGKDPTVVTDQMILSHVQAAVAALPEIPQMGSGVSPP